MDDDIRSAIAESITDLENPGDERNQGQEVGGAPAAPTPAAPAAGQSRQRDPAGRFAAPGASQEPLPTDPVAPVAGQKAPATPAPGGQPAAQPSRAPVSWTPEAREVWNTLPPQAQAEVTRREREINDALRTTSEARNFYQQAGQLFAPYMHMIQAEGSTPIKAMDNLLRTAAFLRTAPPQQRAMALADLVVQHGVDIGMLDQALNARLSGQQPQQDPMSHLYQQLDQRLAPIQSFVNQLQNQQQMTYQQQAQQVGQTIEEFLNDPVNEYARDVAGDMADLLELAANRGQPLSLQEAYKRATLAHPTIAPLVEKRMLEQGAAQRTAAASRARNAAVSVPDSGAPSQSGDDGNDGSIRSALNASIRQLAGSR